jgi:hypothetical protein
VAAGVGAGEGLPCLGVWSEGMQTKTGAVGNGHNLKRAQPKRVQIANLA